MRKKLLLTFLLITAWAAPVRAEIGIEAVIEPSRVMVGDSMTLIISVKGSARNIQVPQLPNVPNIRSYPEGHSQEFVFANGVMSAQHIFEYVLVPTAPGKQTLGQIEINIDGKVYKTGVLEVDVYDPSGGQPQPQPQQQSGRSGQAPAVIPASPRTLPPEFQAGQEIFVRAWTDKEEVYVNEAVSLTYTIYTRVSATYKGFDKEPVTTGFWVEEIPLAKTAASRQEKDIGGYRYIVADVRTLVLFPSEPGSYNIDPGVLKADAEIPINPGAPMYGTDLFGRRRMYPQAYAMQVVPRLFQTQSIPILVKPLPQEGRPSNFTGAVGKYKLESTVDKTAVEEGQPITHRLKLSGEGNLNTVELPKLPELDYFKSYDSSSSLNLDKSKFYVHGEKTLETVLIAKKAGAYSIPPLSFSFFNPGTGKYQTLTTNPIAVSVKPSADIDTTASSPAPTPSTPKEVALLGEDIRYIKTATAPFTPERKPWMKSSGYWIANASALVLALLLLLIKFVSDRSSQNLGGMRLKRSHRLASQRLKEARAFLKKGSSDGFYEALARGFYGYFSDKLNLDPGETDLHTIEARVRAKFSDEEWGQLKSVLEQIHLGRFARTETSEQSMRALYDRCEDAIAMIQGKRL